MSTGSQITLYSQTVRFKPSFALWLQKADYTPRTLPHPYRSIMCYFTLGGKYDHHLVSKYNPPYPIKTFFLEIFYFSCFSMLCLSSPKRSPPIQSSFSGVQNPNLFSLASRRFTWRQAASPRNRPLRKLQKAWEDSPNGNGKETGALPGKRKYSPDWEKAEKTLGIWLYTLFLKGT